MCLLRGTDWVFVYNSGYVFCVDLRTNSDYFPIQHWLSLYNLDGECLLRGTDWVFIYNSGCVLCGSENKQRLFPYTTLTDWVLQPIRSVFTARYGLDRWMFKLNIALPIEVCKTSLLSTWKGQRLSWSCRLYTSEFCALSHATPEKVFVYISCLNFEPLSFTCYWRIVFFWHPVSITLFHYENVFSSPQSFCRNSLELQVTNAEFHLNF